jgi:putative transposase
MLCDGVRKNCKVSASARVGALHTSRLYGARRSCRGCCPSNWQRCATAVAGSRNRIEDALRELGLFQRNSATAGQSAVATRKLGGQRQRIYRLYIKDGLAVRTKVRKKIARRQRVPLLRATQPKTERGPREQPADGRRFRVPVVVDQFTREYLVLLADSSLRGQKVAPSAVPNIIAELGVRRCRPPSTIALNSKVRRWTWSDQHGAQLDFIRPGRPVENRYIESSNGRLVMSA